LVGVPFRKKGISAECTRVDHELVGVASDKEFVPSRIKVVVPLLTQFSGLA
jgi:hypothetical protein